MNFKKILMILALTVIVLFSCKKEYYRDSGVHKPNFDGSILAYLKSKPVYFDTLTKVIEIAGMNDYFDKEKEITFFAPTSSTIYKSIKGLNSELKRNGRDTVAKLEQIKPEAWRALLSMYVFKGANRLKDYPQLDTLNMAAFPGQGYTSLNGRTMNIGVFYNSAGSVQYAGYRQLYLAYIPNYSEPKVGLIYAPVASSDIAPTNGIVHVLVQDAIFANAWRSKHNFGFLTSNFINTVETYGISSPTP